MHTNLATNQPDGHSTIWVLLSDLWQEWGPAASPSLTGSRGYLLWELIALRGGRSCHYLTDGGQFIPLEGSYGRGKK